MKTRTTKATTRRKTSPRGGGAAIAAGGGRGTAGAGKRGILPSMAAGVLLLVVGFGAYRAGEALSSSAIADDGIVISVAQAGVDTVTRVGKERAKVKGAGGSVFSEGDAPTVVGDIPAGWRVETSPDVKAKFGPQPVPGGEDITFVVPVYTLVPEEKRAGAYVMEPGRTAEGQDGGGTLSGVLGRMQGESTTIGAALATLSDSLRGLEAMVPVAPEGDAVEGAEAGAQ